MRKNLGPPDDKTLVALYLSGNEKAFCELFTRHVDAIKRTISYVLNPLSYSEALREDLLQDTLLRAIEQLKDGKYSEEEKFAGWITTIARHLCIDYLRVQQRKWTQEEQYAYFLSSKCRNHGVVPSAGEVHIMRQETITEVRKLIGQLSPEQQEVVDLRIYGGFQFQQIAEMLDISRSTCAGRMRYALIRMRKIMNVPTEPLLKVA